MVADSDDSSLEVVDKDITTWNPYPLIIFLLLTIIHIISAWKIFVKARKPGWVSLIPIYNLIVELKIVGKPCWWTLLYLVPVINIIAYAIVICLIGNCFNKSSGFKIGLLIFPFIFRPILAFDSSKYTEPIDIDY